ncbi:disease resistance protein ADR1-like [Rosa rugosa]|uniref:disease resistance protein ADR1-like n=1 Tax=Rosa rugosa TaxID=74645 RepID=UPI002B412665|nr:disease resistance protein ADR1-like [Rosa rugosa]
MWLDRLNQWSKGSSIFDSETDLLFSLQSSLDALDKERAIIRECFLDLGSFPEDKEIPVDALIDIWSELYEIDEDTSCIANLYELNNQSLANLIDNRYLLPEFPEIVVGLEAPLKDLKTKLLGNDGLSMLVLTAPGGCGKTTLAANFCKDKEVKDKFGKNIFFVTVSKKYSLNSIVVQLYRQKGSQVPAFQNEVNEVQWLQTFLKEEGEKPSLLVLDDVCPLYRLNMLDNDDAMKLFSHSASLNDKSSHIPAHLSRKIVERCKGFPLAITVVGRSLCAQPIEMWLDRLNQWSKGSSIFDSETDLLFSLQSSLDALDKERAIIRECFLDLGSFPEDKEIPVDALIDIWSELYEIDEDTSCIANLYELNNRSLANLIDNMYLCMFLLHV